jgi:very-short-patch-repair endonuclease
MNAKQRMNSLIAKASILRANPTAAEERLKVLLEREGDTLPNYHFQHVVYPFIADFAFLSILLIIEVDGSVHDNRSDSDDIREYELEVAGWKIIRFSNSEVFNSPQEVIAQIRYAIQSRKKDRIPLRPEPKFTRSKNRRMVIPLPRVVYEEPTSNYSRTRASKVRVRKALAKGEKAEIFCAICANPIARADTRVRFKGSDAQTLWVHKSCQT